MRSNSSLIVAFRVRHWLLRRLRLIAVTGLLLLCVGAIGGFVFAWSGLYSVAASRGHWPITTKFLHFGLRNSIETHSLTITPPNLEDGDLIRLGAAHFANGCAVCHGSPGRPAAATLKQMLPHPPSLPEAVQKWDAAELFWIVKNGLKFTGMPAWPSQSREDEVWAVVAFLQKLPGLTSQSYRGLANLPDPGGPSSQPPLLHEGSPPQASECIRCHGDTGTDPISRHIPKIQGLSASYLEFSLHSYKVGSRPSGVMRHFSAPLTTQEIAEIAEFYARPPSESSQRERLAAPGDGEIPLDQIERGRSLAEGGIPSMGIPPCRACHDNPAKAIFPRLAGQYAPYISRQLKLWQDGHRTQTALGQIMAPIAKRLTPEQIEDVATYYEQLPVLGRNVQQ